MNKLVLFSLCLSACASPSAQDRVEKALHEGVDSMLWGASSTKLGVKTEQPVLEESLYKSFTVSLKCYTQGTDKTSLNNQLISNYKLNAYCFKNDHLVAAFKIYSGFRDFNVLKPEKVAPVVKNFTNQDRIVAWSSESRADTIQFYSLFYYQENAGFAIISDDTLLHDNLSKKEKEFYKQKMKDNQFSNIYSTVRLDSVIKK